MCNKKREPYIKPKVSLFFLGSSLNFLTRGFSGAGVLGDFDEGGEFGIDEDGNSLGEFEDGGEF